MLGVARLLTVFLLAGLASSAHGKPVRHLTRRLSPSESEQVRRVTESFVSLVADAARRAKHDCRIAEPAGGRTLSQPPQALAVVGGLAPLYRGVQLHCDGNLGGSSSPSISIRLALDPQNRQNLAPPRKAGNGPGLRRWTSSSKAEALYLEGDSGHAEGIQPAVRIDIHSEGPTGIPEALEPSELARLLAGVSLLPVPPRKAGRRGPGDSSTAEREREVIAAVIAEVAGEGSQVVVRAAPSRTSVSLDEEALVALAAVAPDLDSKLFRSFKDRLRTGPAPALPANAQTVEDTAVDAALDPGGWAEFHRRFPSARGTLTLSPIAFGSSGEQAVVAAGWQQGPLSGIGAMYVLQRDAQGAWIILYEAILWLS